MVTQPNSHAVILANGRSNIWGGRTELPFAALPVAGKSLLGHKIDEIRELGVRRLTIVTDCTEEVGAILNVLPLFEFSIRVVSSEAIELNDERALVTDASFLTEPMLSRISDATHSVVLQARDGTPVGANLTAPEIKSVAIDGFSPLIEVGHSLIATGQVMHIDSVQTLVRANVAVLNKKFAVTRVSGLEIAPHIWLEWAESARPANICGPSHIGDNAVLDPTARISDTSIGRGASALSGSVLEQCVVLPGAVVPRGVHLREAIVTDNLILFADDEPSEEFGQRTERGFA